jgi:hypothetical protein
MIKDVQMQIAATKNQARLNTFPALFGLAVLILMVLGVLYYTQVSNRKAVVSPVNISQAELTEKYGLQVNLVAVTAAGGLVDTRIRIVNGEKAKALLSDKENFPSLSIHDRIMLSASEDIKSQEVRFENESTMFIIYANSGGVVKKGTPVKIVFGDIAVDAIPAQ